MESTKNAGRLVGALFVLQATCGMLGNITLLKPVMAAPGFLVNAATHASNVSWAVLFNLGGGALAIAIAIAAWPVLRPLSRGAAMWLFALATANFALNAVENVALLSMLSVSHEATKAGATDASLYEALGQVVRMLRYWAHYMKLMCGVGVVVLLFASMLRFALVPRALAALATLATGVQLVAVTLPVFGSPINFNLITPAGVMTLSVALWLLVRGFAPATPSSHRAAPMLGSVSP